MRRWPSCRASATPIRWTIQRSSLLRHLAIIPDGNRRWARAQGLPDAEGHRRGFLTVMPEVVRWWVEHTEIPTLTLWLFSTDNWKRSAAEVEALMQIYTEMIPILREITGEQAGISHIGRKDRLPEGLAGLPVQEGGARRLRLAIDYGGQEEIVGAVGRIIARGEEVTRERISEEIGEGPDLIVRTSGEQRLSGFLLWGSVYGEVVFLKEMWPEVGGREMEGAVREFEGRGRRFGG